MKKTSYLKTSNGFVLITAQEAYDIKYGIDKARVWEECESNFYFLDKEDEHTRLVFQTARRDFYSTPEELRTNSFFRFRNTVNDVFHSGGGEGERHDFFKQVIRNINVLDLCWNGNHIRVFPESIVKENPFRLETGTRRADLTVYFRKSDPVYFAKKCNGILTIEIEDSHSVDTGKMLDFKRAKLACFEFNVRDKEFPGSFGSGEEYIRLAKEYRANLDGINGHCIKGKLLVDPNEDIDIREFKFLKNIWLKNENLEEQNKKILFEKINHALSKYFINVLIPKNNSLPLDDRILVTRAKKARDNIYSLNYKTKILFELFDIKIKNLKKELQDVELENSDLSISLTENNSAYMSTHAQYIEQRSLFEEADNMLSELKNTVIGTSTPVSDNLVNRINVAVSKRKKKSAVLSAQDSLSLLTMYEYVNCHLSMTIRLLQHENYILKKLINNDSSEN